MALVVAVLSLLFTVFSFWWLQARPGRLIGYAPSTFTARISCDSVSVRIPVATYNSGARSRVVRELRLVLSYLDDRHVLRWNDFRRTLGATDREKADDFADYASSFVIRGREGDERFVTFVGEATSDWPLEPVDYRARIQARIDKHDDWVDLDTFTLHLWHIATSVGTYTSHHNTPEPCTEDERGRSRRAFIAAAEKWNLPKPAWAEDSDV